MLRFAIVVVFGLVVGCGDGSLNNRRPIGFGPARDQLAPPIFIAAPEGPWIEPGDNDGVFFADGIFADLRMDDGNFPPNHVSYCRIGPPYELHADYIEFDLPAGFPRIIATFQVLEGGRALMIDDHRNPPVYLVRPRYVVSVEDCLRVASRDTAFPRGTVLTDGVSVGFLGR